MRSKDILCRSEMRQQIRILRGRPFSPDDIQNFRPIIFWNLAVGARNLHNAIVDMGLTVNETVRSHLKATDLVYLRDIGDDEPFPKELLGHLKALWEDPNLQQAWKQGNGTALSEK